MKKIILSLAALMMFGGSVMAQDKAAEKAAKEALKAAEKQADNQIKSGIALRDEVMNLYQGIQMEKQKGDKAKQEVIDENTKNIKTKSIEALDQLQAAFASGHVAEKKYFDGYKAMDDVASQLLNPELQLAANKQTFDTLTFAKSVDGVCDGCYGTLQYGKEKDEFQKPTIVTNKLKMPKLMTYYAYLCIFYTETKNLKGACDAFDKYKAFPTKYPLVANDPIVQNPEYPYAQFAFNIYYTAYQLKQFDVCQKYYEEAVKFEDPTSHNFVVSSLPEMYKQMGNTDQWIAELKKMIKNDPKSENAEVATQNLLAHYSQQGVGAMNSFADEILASDPTSKIANYGKGYALVTEHKYAEALEYYKKSVETDPEYVDGNYQCGFCLYQIGLENGRKISDKKYKSQQAADAEAEKLVKSYLRQAAPYFEKVRELKPNDSDRWANELKVIYTNIGEKAKAKEMSDILGF